MNKSIPTVAGLAAAGTLFAGYISGTRYFSNSCAFGETCPTFLSVPACYIGLAIFLVLLTVSLLGLAGRSSTRTTLQTNAAMALTGVITAGYATARDMHDWWFALSSYRLGLPACAYGALMFAAIFVISLGELIHLGHQHLAQAHQ